MEFVHRLAGDGYLPQDLLRVGTQSLARNGKRKFAVVALEEASTKGLLQSTNPGANRRLAYAKSFGRAMETAIGCNCQKSFELEYFHGRGASVTLILDVPIEIVYRCDNYNPFD
jgi:hypothetical protein